MLSDRAASIKSGLSPDGIRTIRRQFENGRQTSVTSATLEKLARGLETTPLWLLKEEGPETLVSAEHIDSAHILEDAVPPKKVRVVGYVGAGSEAHYYALADDAYEEVDPPGGVSDQTVAVEIRGTSLGRLLNSWLVFYKDVRAPVEPDQIGQLCVVGLADDRILVKQIRRERDGSYTLISNSTDEAPIENAQIEWAAKVTDMRPR